METFARKNIYILFRFQHLSWNMKYYNIWTVYSRNKIGVTFILNAHENQIFIKFYRSFTFSLVSFIFCFTNKCVNVDLNFNKD